MKILKRTLVILVIILLILISFGGIFIQKNNSVKNIMPEFKLGADLAGNRNIGLAVSTETKTIIYDKDGNIVEEEGKETTKKEEPVNDENILTKENYNKTKQIIEKRLNTLKAVQNNLSEQKAVDNYIIKQDNETGKLELQIPENDYTNMVLQYIAIKGVFNIVDEDNIILMDNSHIEKAEVGYSSTDSGITVYLTIQLNKEGTEKLREISNTYVKTTDEEGNDTTKKVTVKIDDTEMVSTYFAEEISNGMIQLSFGTAASNSENLVTYVQEANNLAVLLNSGNLPITYTMEENRYVLSYIDSDMAMVSAIIIASLVFVGLLFIIIKYKLNGLLAAISHIGYIALLLIIIRITNVILTLEGIAGILVAIILNYAFIVYILHLLKNNEEITFIKAFTKALIILVPIAITTIIFSFVKWLPIYSFGMTMFWGITFIILYNFIVTKTLIYKK